MEVRIKKKIKTIFQKWKSMSAFEIEFWGKKKQLS